MTSNYTYDPLYELTQVTQGANTTESYTYDAVGNRLSSLGVSPYVNNTSNELTSTPNASYSYDYNGNTTSKTVSSGTTNYTWDYENRLASVTLPGTGGSITFKYDPLGRRIQKVFTQNSTSTTTNYLYDGSNAVADIDQNGNVLARYAETQNIDEPLAELRSGTTSYYEADGLGSVTSLTSGAGAIANTYTYDSFGKLTASTGSITNRFQYTAREFDSESGLYYYRARYYDSNAGRFVSEDPIGSSAGLNFYAYVDNSPTLFDDPFGLWKNKGVPADPNKNTIVCDGQGGIRVQLDRNFQLLPERKECLGPCTVQHEEVHKRDALASNPKICRGSADGIQIGFSNDLEGDRSEIAAHKVGIKCIEDQLRHEKCEACRNMLKGQLALDQTYLKMFEFYLERDLHKSN